MTLPPPTPFPLDAYLDRVGISLSPTTGEQSLIALHRAQVFTLPFENLNPWTGMPVRTDQESLLQKMVFDRAVGRGGYCFELNQLFLFALRAAGFKTKPLCARVWRGDHYGPRSHQITLVEIGGRPWLADVGFGGNGLLDPLPFETDRESDQVLDTYRIRKDEDFGYRLESLLRGQWRPLYAFSLDLFTDRDFQAMNYFVSTSPESLFTQIGMCMRPTARARHLFYGNLYKVRGLDGGTQQHVPSATALRTLLETHFNLAWPGKIPLREPCPPPPGARPID